MFTAERWRRRRSCNYIRQEFKRQVLISQLVFPSLSTSLFFPLLSISMTGSFVLYGIIILLLLFVVRHVIYPAFFSPLAKIPNAHPLAPFTGLWMLWIRYQEKVNKTVNTAHQKYGPVVRLGPSELSVNCIENGVKTIYGTKTFPKHHFYSAFRNFK
jgi:hypothetical protein